MKIDKKKIFIVDNDESVGRALKCLLTTFGFEVETFLSGKAFFDVITDIIPGCLLVDFYLSELDGLKVRQRLFKLGSKRSVVVMSAENNTEITDEVSKSEAVGFLQKPFSDKDLLAVMNLAFEKI